MLPDTTIDLTISTVYFNSKHIGKTVRSVSQNLFKGVFEHFIVDNNSSDKSFLESIGRHSWLRIVANEQNIGFAKANNVALQRAHGKYFLYLNPDIQLEPDALNKLTLFMDATPTAVAVGCRMTDKDNRLLASCRRFPTLRIVCSRFLSWVPGTSKLLAYYEMKDVDHSVMQNVDWISGSLLLCRTELLKKIDGMDERYFLYFEDVDLCRTLRQFGSVVYFPNVSAIHLTEHSSRKNFKLFSFHIRSALTYFLKWGVTF